MTKRKLIIAGAIVFVILFIITAAGLFFFQFTSIGYRMSVPYRSSFKKLDDNVYINRIDEEEVGEIRKMIVKSKERVGDFYGELEGEADTIFILCDDKKLLYYLGGDHDTKTIFFPTKKNYIVLSPDYFTVDILAHELTHAELHSRLESSALSKLPTWFDEGLAMQNDYRKHYNCDAWTELTDNGRNVLAPDSMDEPSEFYSGSEDDVRLRYVISKYEVGDWMDANKREGLLKLIEKLNSGEEFYTAYKR